MADRTEAVPPPPLRELVAHLTRGVVEHPDRVSVTETEREGTTIIEVRVAAEDVGKVIGRQGRIIQAIRTVARAAAARRGRRVAVEVVD
jgi:predicted RNA-binding protein YlqC (UPF0109 family)